VPWQIYLLISILLLSCNGLFHRSILKEGDSSPQGQTLVFLGLGGIISIIIALVQGKLNLLFPPALAWNFLLLIALLTPAYLLKYRSYQLIGASEVVMFSVTGRLWNVVGAYVFLHEAITLKMILGAMLILGGAMLTRYEKKKFVLNRGVLIVLISAFLFGMGDINGYFVLRSYDSTNFLVYSYLLPVAALLLLHPSSFNKIKYYFRKDRAIKVILLGLCDTFGMLTLYLAYQVGRNAAVIGPLRSTNIIVTVILAIIILRERTNIKNKLIGAAIAVVGVVLLL
jgi:drug/metabolite transporter (DMT)-like permease